MTRLVGSLVVYILLFVGVFYTYWPDMTRNSITTIGVSSSFSILPRIIVVLTAVFMSYYYSLLDYFFKPVTSSKELKEAYWFKERNDLGE